MFVFMSKHALKAMQGRRVALRVKRWNFSQHQITTPCSRQARVDVIPLKVGFIKCLTFYFSECAVAMPCKHSLIPQLN